MIELNYQLAEDFVRLALKQNFAEKNHQFTIKKIAGDASFRSYYRINFFNDNFSLILMFAPPAHEKLEEFILVNDFLQQNNFRSPKIYSRDLVNGLLLLEDFGDDTFTNVLTKKPDQEYLIYQKACDVLLSLHKIKPELTIDNYNNQILQNEVMLFIDWYLKLENKKISLAQISQFKKLWLDLFDKIANKQSVVVLRDYHADNLMLLNNNQNSCNSIGVLDFQDALVGSPAYDLVSLLDDIRREILPENRQKLYDYFFANYSQNLADFKQDCQILSLQRNIKILGIFARLVLRDNKPKYLDYLPRVKYFVELRLNEENKIFDEIKLFLKQFL